MPKTLWLMRHAENRKDGAFPLSDRGRTQVEAVAARILETIRSHRF